MKSEIGLYDAAFLTFAIVRVYGVDDVEVV